MFDDAATWAYVAFSVVGFLALFMIHEHARKVNKNLHSIAAFIKCGCVLPICTHAFEEGAQRPEVVNNFRFMNAANRKDYFGWDGLFPYTLIKSG